MNLALKYRPRSLDDLAGQEVFVQTIRNAIAMDSLSDVFMLCGPSGSGKTTSARILALCINCETGVTSSPCLECKNCREIINGIHPDVVEIDAASRTGIDDIRSVINSTHYSPLNGKFKLYIIDEVHMLSQSAFNALLKTIEQPAAHTKFILATTEIQKVPDTVVSRCQSFQFNKISQATIALTLKNIAKKEDVPLDDKSADLIASKSHGSLRNGLILLDQIISYSNKNPTFEESKQVLGVIDQQLMLNLVENILDRQPAKALSILDELQKILDPVIVMENLSTIIYKLSILDATGQNLFEQEHHNKAKLLLVRANQSLLTRTWQVTHICINEIKESYDAVITARMAIIKLCLLSGLPSPATIVQQLRQRKTQEPVKTHVNAPEDIKPVVDEPAAYEGINTFGELVSNLLDDSELELHKILTEKCTSHKFEDGAIELITSNTNQSFGTNLEKYLKYKTGKDWSLKFLAPLDDKTSDVFKKIESNQAIQALINKFSGSKIDIIPKKND